MNYCFDKNFLLNNLGGDDELYNLLAISFISSHYERKIKLKESVHTFNFDSIALEYHTLKGLFSMFGANEFADVTQKVEVAALKKDIEIINKHYLSVIEFDEYIIEKIKESLNF